MFAIALEDSNGGAKVAPNIYLGATSMFGLHIVKPDSNGDGNPDRTKRGAAGATWMPGMFAEDKGGSPGAIWRVDGTTGEVKLFATIPGNSGAGIGDIVYDKASKQLFVSDLDTGLIHRLDANGQLIDTFDHGVSGRPAKGLAAVNDDGSKADITSPGFDVEKPETWGYTQKERRVHGMAVREGRLYYAVDRQVWSIGIAQDGHLASDARWELDVATTAADTQLSDMLFDGEGRMFVAERAGQRGSYDFSLYAEAEKAEVKRYSLETPDDPATPSRWVEVAETYAIGLPPEHRHSNGGIALGFPYDETGTMKIGSCGQFLWTTGERLRAGEFAQGDAEGDPAANADVHGLQGNPVGLVRPQNVPPMTSYFTDYDSFFGDAEKAGHIGDVEIWQPCDGAPGVQTLGELPPGWVPPGDEIPPGFPPEFPPPEVPYQANLELRKRANPKSCWSIGSNWLCRYQVRVRNTGPDNYFGHILVRDFFPANPAGLDTAFQPQPPWACWHVGGNPANTRCWRPNTFLAPGQSVFLNVWAKIPKNPLRCRLTNVAEIEWAPGGSQWNSDPNDDIDSATAIIPDPRCDQKPRRSNLKLEKKAEFCRIVGNSVLCRYHVSVENTGPDNFLGPISVRDQLPAGVVFAGAPLVNWNCGSVGGNTFECTHKNPANVFLGPTDKVHLWVFAALPIADAKQHDCKLRNRAWITNPLGAPQNTDAGDDSDSATADMPPELCREQRTNLKIEKSPFNEACYGNDLGGASCSYIIRVTLTSPGPFNGAIHVRDTAPPGAVIIPGPGTHPWGCDPQVGNTRLCKLANVALPNAGSFTEFRVELSFSQNAARQNECRSRNEAEIVLPVGAPKNTNAGDDQDDAVMNMPSNICRQPPPEPQQCPPGYVFDDGQCVPKNTQCPSGWSRTPIKDKCCPPGERWNGRTCSERPIEPPGIIDPIPPVIPPVVDFCPGDMQQVSSLRAHYLRHQGWTVVRIRHLWCVRPPVETPCPPGFEQVPQSRVPYLRHKGWVIFEGRHGKWCGKPGREPPAKECPEGTYGKYPDCNRRPPEQSCESRGMVGNWPNCRPVDRCDAACECKKSGGRWSDGRCQHGVSCWDGSKAPSQRQCPPRTHKCWNGQLLPAGKSCPPQQSCEDKGMVGKWPNCRRKEPQTHKCWNGQVLPAGRPCPPRRERCGPGFTGVKPNCTPIRKACPRGTVGKYQPHCKEIRKRPDGPKRGGPQRPGSRINLR